jgi:hypothetical protein
VQRTEERIVGEKDVAVANAGRAAMIERNAPPMVPTCTSEPMPAVTT